MMMIERSDIESREMGKEEDPKKGRKKESRYIKRIYYIYSKGYLKYHKTQPNLSITTTFLKFLVRLFTFRLARRYLGSLHLF
jgi:hypothetical protein